MAHLTLPTALHPSSGPIQAQPLLITQIVFGGKLYRVEARLDDGAGGPLPFTAQYSQEAMRQIQNYTEDLFSAHELHLNSLSQQALAVIGANSQGLIQQDNTTISHDFLIEPLDRGMADRIAPDVAPISHSALKAQDIWNHLSSSILAFQTAAPPPSISSAILTTPSPITPPTDLTPLADPLATHTNSTPLTNPSTPLSDDLFFPDSCPPSTPHPDALLTPPIDSTGTNPLEPVRTLPPPLDDTTALTDLSIPTHLHLDPPHIDQQITLPERLPRRIVLSTELQLKDHDFNAENWYETIPVRVRLRICQNILKAHSTQPVEWKVWNRFQEIYEQQASRDRNAPTTAQLIQKEARRLLQQRQSQPSTLKRRQRSQGEHFLRKITENAPQEELNQRFKNYRLNDQFYRFFEEQIEAEGLPIAESDRPAWVRAHYTEDLPRFARVLERYLDSN